MVITYCGPGRSARRRIPHLPKPGVLGFSQSVPVQNLGAVAIHLRALQFEAEFASSRDDELGINESDLGRFLFTQPFAHFSTSRRLPPAEQLARHRRTEHYVVTEVGEQRLDVVGVPVACPLFSDNLSFSVIRIYFLLPSHSVSVVGVNTGAWVGRVGLFAIVRGSSLSVFIFVASPDWSLES